MDRLQSSQYYHEPTPQLDADQEAQHCTFHLEIQGSQRCSFGSYLKSARISAGPSHHNLLKRNNNHILRVGKILPIISLIIGIPTLKASSINPKHDCFFRIAGLRFRPDVYGETVFAELVADLAEEFEEDVAEGSEIGLGDACCVARYACWA